MKYSKTTKCFYPKEIQYANLPADIIEIEQTYYDKAMARNVGETFDFIDGVLVINTAPVLTREQIIRQVWEKIKSERTRRQNAGVNVGGVWFNSDLESRTKHVNLAALGDDIAPNLQWKTLNGAFVTMTTVLAKSVIKATAQSDQAIFDAAQTHYEALNASGDPANYDYSSNWPKLYGE